MTRLWRPASPKRTLRRPDVRAIDMPDRTVFRSLANVGIAGNARLKRITSAPNATEYDFSCTPEDTMRTAAAIDGASVTIMEQLGHFPMSENPEQFRRYIAPVLGRILKQSTFTKQGEHA
jgi:pimeloyl-ACP methyl ester carboxylesterase